jgi:hypothetical protein
MLCLGRFIGESVIIQTDMSKLLDPFEMDALLAAAKRPDAVGSALQKVIAHLAVPVKVGVNDIRSGRKVRLEFDAMGAVRVDREEVVIERAKLK